MAKRSGTEAQTATTSDGPEAKRPFGAQAQQNGAENEMGEFEDQWEDELEDKFIQKVGRLPVIVSVRD